MPADALALARAAQTIKPAGQRLRQRKGGQEEQEKADKAPAESLSHETTRVFDFRARCPRRLNHDRSTGGHSSACAASLGSSGSEPVAGHLVEALQAARISRLRLRRHRDAGAWRARAPPRRRQARHSGKPPAQGAARRPYRHRPYALGDAWRADRGQRPSARHRQGRHRPQRHHREFPRAARRSCQGRLHAQDETDTEVVALWSRASSIAGLDAGEGGRAPRSSSCAAPLRSPSCSSGEDDLLIGARKGAPLAVGYGETEMYLGSDAMALAPFTYALSYLRDGDWAVITRKGVTIRDGKARPSSAPIVSRQASAHDGRQGQPPAFHGQGNPRAARSGRPHARALRRHGARTRRAAGQAAVRLAQDSSGCRSRPAARPTMPGWWRNTGSSASPGCRSMSMSPPSSATASAPLEKGDLAHLHLAVGRDRRHAGGAALRARSTSSTSSSVVNVPTSTIARESDVVLPTLAGPEIGVASTKAFTCQLAALACLAIAAGRARGELSRAGEQKLVRALDRSAAADVGSARARAADREARAATSPRRATCSISAAAPAFRSRWKAR